MIKNCFVYKSSSVIADMMMIYQWKEKKKHFTSQMLFRNYLSYFFKTSMLFYYKFVCNLLIQIFKHSSYGVGQIGKLHKQFSNVTDT